MIAKADLIHYGILVSVTVLTLIVPLALWAGEQREARNAQR